MYVLSIYKATCGTIISHIFIKHICAKIRINTKSPLGILKAVYHYGYANEKVDLYPNKTNKRKNPYKQIFFVFFY